MKTLHQIRTFFGVVIAVAILGAGIYVVDQYLTPRDPTVVVYSINWSHRPPANVHYARPDGSFKSVSHDELIANNPQSADYGGTWAAQVPYVKGFTYIINADAIDVATVLHIAAGSHSAASHATHDREHVSCPMLAIW